MNTHVVRLPRGWFMRDLKKAAARAARWSAPPMRNAPPKLKEKQTP